MCKVICSEGKGGWASHTKWELPSHPGCGLPCVAGLLSVFLLSPCVCLWAARQPGKPAFQFWGQVTGPIRSNMWLAEIVHFFLVCLVGERHSRALESRERVRPWRGYGMWEFGWHKLWHDIRMCPQNVLMTWRLPGECMAENINSPTHIRAIFHKNWWSIHTLRSWEIQSFPLYAQRLFMTRMAEFRSEIFGLSF